MGVTGSGERGSINNPDRVEGQRDFTGLKYGEAGEMTPTDLDCSFDLRGKIFIITEAKFKDAPLKDGQRRHIAALVDAINTGKYRAIGFIVEHESESGKEIVFAKTKVRQVRISGSWVEPKEPLTLREAYDKFIAQRGYGHLIKKEYIK